MTQNDILNVKLSISQLNKSKSGIKNGPHVTLNLSSNVVSDSYYETNFLHQLLLTNTHVSRFYKAFPNGSLANMKLSKTHLSKMVQLGGGSFLGTLGVAFDPNKITDSSATPQSISYKEELIKKRCIENRKNTCKIFL